MIKSTTMIISISIEDQKNRVINLNFPNGDQKKVSIDSDLYENFKSIFVREKGKYSKLQTQKYNVLMELMKAAYISGKGSQ